MPVFASLATTLFSHLLVSNPFHQSSCLVAVDFFEVNFGKVKSILKPFLMLVVFVRLEVLSRCFDSEGKFT